MSAVRLSLTSKFVWKRIPQDMKKKSKDLQIIWKVSNAATHSTIRLRRSTPLMINTNLTCFCLLFLLLLLQLLTPLHRLDYSTFFSSSSSLPSSLSVPLLQRLVARLRDQVKTDNIDNIRKAYTVIGVEQAAALLGTPKEETAAFLLSLGWTADPQAPSEFFLPTPLALPKQRDISTQQIEQLTSYIVQLERE